MKLSSVAIISCLLGVLVLAGCPFSESREEGCKPQAVIVAVDGGRSHRVTFQESLAETLNGETNCDFAYRPIEAKDPTAGGVSLKRVDIDGKPWYTADRPIDLKKPEITFEWGGRRYFSEPEQMSHIGDSTWFRMTRLPPK